METRSPKTLSNLPKDLPQGSEAHLQRARPGSNHTPGTRPQGIHGALGDTGARGIFLGDAEFPSPVLWDPPHPPPDSAHRPASFFPRWPLVTRSPTRMAARPWKQGFGPKISRQQIQVTGPYLEGPICSREDKGPEARAEPGECFLNANLSAFLNVLL